MHVFFLEILEVLVKRGGVKTEFVGLRPFLAVDGCVQGTLGFDPHDALFVVDADDRVQRTRIDRFRYVEQPAWSHDPGDLRKCRTHQFHRNVVKGFQHDRQVERCVGKGDLLGAGSDERKSFLRVLEILLVLDAVHLEPGDATAGVALQQIARKLGCAAAQFNDVLVIESDPVIEQGEFVLDDR